MSNVGARSRIRTGGGEAVATLGEDLHEVVSQVTASQVQTEDGVGKGITWKKKTNKQNITP